MPFVFDDAKDAVGAVYPPGVVESPQLKLEPLLGPEQLISRHLFGIPLQSGVKDPLTGKFARLEETQLADIIQGAVAQAEHETHLDILPVQVQEKHSWDKCDYASFGYFRLEHRPCAAIQALEVSPPDNSSIFEVPLEWVETARLVRGQVNIIPLMVALQSGTGQAAATPAGAAVFLAMFSDRHFIPSFWRITYTSGFPDGQVPRLVNDLVGTIAAMEVLSMLAATHAHVTSGSLGIDGLSQSVGTPGPQRYQVRLQELADKRKMLARKLRAMYGQTLFSGQV